MSAGVRIKDPVLRNADGDRIRALFKERGITISSVKLTARALTLATSFTPASLPGGGACCGPYAVNLRIAESEDDSHALSVRLVGVSPRAYGHINSYHAQELASFKALCVEAWTEYLKEAVQ